MEDAKSERTIEPNELREIEAQFKDFRKAYRSLGWGLLLFLFLLFLPLAVTTPQASDLDFFWMHLPAYAVGCFCVVAYLNYLAEVESTARVLGESVFVYVVGTIILHVCGPMISYYLLERSLKRLTSGNEAFTVKR